METECIWSEHGIEGININHSTYPSFAEYWSLTHIAPGSRQKKRGERKRAGSAEWMDCCSGTFQSKALQLCDSTALLHHSEMPPGIAGGGSGGRKECFFSFLDGAHGRYFFLSNVSERGTTRPAFALQIPPCTEFTEWGFFVSSSQKQGFSVFAFNVHPEKKRYTVLNSELIFSCFFLMWWKGDYLNHFCIQSTCWEGGRSAAQINLCKTFNIRSDNQSSHLLAKTPLGIRTSGNFKHPFLLYEQSLYSLKKKKK